MKVSDLARIIKHFPDHYCHGWDDGSITISPDSDGINHIASMSIDGELMQRTGRDATGMSTWEEILD